MCVYIYIYIYGYTYMKEPDRSMRRVPRARGVRKVFTLRPLGERDGRARKHDCGSLPSQRRVERARPRICEAPASSAGLRALVR